MAPRSSLVATAQQQGVHGIVVPILLALAENALIPIENLLVFGDNLLAPLENHVPVENPPLPAENHPKAIENPALPVESPAPVNVDRPHFPGHFPVVVPVQNVPAIALVEVAGIVPPPETSSLLLSLFGN
ncbi:unnamed protein product [Rhizoctonia solani]|uniref:Uncharacterized protein n=1 Tax=Rhizoctonia solani TaxID=456999 RepID=A0A8H3HJ65_9AGAM|nr:unnamed protein product [Rhizoctonia solani]